MLVGGVYIICALAQPSMALVYSGGNEHTTAPEMDPGWDSVGRMSVGSGVYLGEGWVLTAYHVYQNEVPGHQFIDLDQRYYEIPGTSHRIKYSETTNADLMMFRIEGAPDLPVLEISNSAPSVEEVTIISNGRSCVGELIDYGDGYQGYLATGARQKRWGRNVTTSYTTTTSSAFGRTKVFRTYFDSPGIGDDECQLVANDSGGGVFHRLDTDQPWTLTGMALSVGISGGYSGPSITKNAVYGAYTSYASLTTYRPQIDLIRAIPLPGDADWDGDVDGVDIQIFRATFGQSGPDLQADFNNDETVNLADFAIIRSNFGMISGGVMAGAESLPVQFVPEPASMALLALAAPVLLRARRRRH